MYREEEKTAKTFIKVLLKENNTPASKVTGITGIIEKKNEKRIEKENHQQKIC